MTIPVGPTISNSNFATSERSASSEIVIDSLFIGVNP